MSEKTRCGTCDQYVPCPCHEKQAPPPPAPSARAEVAEVAALEGEGVQRRLAAALAATASASPAPAPVRPVAGGEVEVGTLAVGTLFAHTNGDTYMRVSGPTDLSGRVVTHRVGSEYEGEFPRDTKVRVVTLAPLAATGDGEQGGKDATERECEVEDKWQAEIDAHAKTRGDAAALRDTVARLEGKLDSALHMIHHLETSRDKRLDALAADRDAQRAGRDRVEATLAKLGFRDGTTDAERRLTADLDAAIRSRADYVDSIREALGHDGEECSVEVIARLRFERDAAVKSAGVLGAENAREREAADRNLKRAEEAERDSTIYENRCEMLSELVTKTEAERDAALAARAPASGGGMAGVSLEERVAELEARVAKVEAARA